MSDHDRPQKRVPVGAVLTIGPLVVAAAALGALEWAAGTGPQPVADAAGRPPLPRMVAGAGAVPPRTPGPAPTGTPGPAGEPGPMPREVKAGP